MSFITSWPGQEKLGLLIKQRATETAVCPGGATRYGCPTHAPMNLQSKCGWEAMQMQASREGRSRSSPSRHPPNPVYREPARTLIAASLRVGQAPEPRLLVLCLRCHRVPTPLHSLLLCHM